MIVNSDLLAEVVEKLKKYSSWLILCHENPDGDTLGCAFALYSLGKRVGKDVCVACRGVLPSAYSFLPYAENLRTVGELPCDEARGALIAAIDISNVSRALTNMAELLSCCADSVNIDHHGDNSCFANTNLIAADASATAEIVVSLFEAYGEGITESEASALYAALVSDNGNFRFNSTSPESHRCAQLLLKAGAKPAEIDDAINENMTEKTLRLWGVALSRTETFADGRCALFWLRASEIDEADANSGALDGLVNMLLRVKGVKTALFLAERHKCCKLSVRSRAPYNARDFAAIYGGGGHVNAAGAKIYKPFEESLESVRKEAENFVSIGNSADL